MTYFNFFQSGSPFLAHPLLTAERTEAEIAFLIEQANLPIGASWLDLGCGFGRHALELARRGYKAVGVDPAAAMISAAQEQANKAGLSIPPRFIQAYAEQFRSPTCFDVAICLFTSLGQLSDRGENSALVHTAYHALKPGGLFFVEVPQRESAVANLKVTDQFGVGERYTAVTRHYTATTKTITESFRLVAPEQTRTYHLQYRLYDQLELNALLTEAGFTISDTWADYHGTPLTPDAPFMLVLGRKL